MIPAHSASGMDRKLKLLVLGDAASLHLRRWLEPLAEKVDIHVITLGENLLHNERITVHRLKRNTRTKIDYFLVVPEMKRLVRRIAPDLLHAHYASSYGFLGSVASVNCPRLLTVWGSDIAEAPWRNPALRRLIRHSLRAYRWINAASDQLADMLVKLGARRELIEVFPYGIDLRKMPLRATPSSPRNYRLLSMRHWQPLYRIDHVIAGFNRYVEEFDDLDLVVTGSGRQADQKRIRQLVSTCKMPDRIQVRGLISQEEMWNEVYRSDIMISVPRTDGAPQSLLESMAAGVLPVVSDIEANRSWLDESRSVIVDRFDPESVKNALREAVKRVSTGFDATTNRKVVEKRADYVKNTERVYDVYRRFAI